MQDPGIHPDALLADMAQIFEMARQHFLLEEQVLAQYGYEELAAHRQEHQHLLKKPVS
jgi:hemerythrin